MLIKFLDIETYKCYFCVCVHAYEDGCEVSRTHYESEGSVFTQEQMTKLYGDLYQCDYLVTFNGTKFDLPILAKIYREIRRFHDMPIAYIYQDAMSLISYDKFNNPVVKKHHRLDEWNCKHFDLLNCCLLNKSLKQWEMYNDLPIRELPYPPSSESLTEQQKAEILDYCHHDTWALATLFFKLGYKDSFAGKPTLLAYRELFQRLRPEFQKKFDRTPASLSATLVYGTNLPIPPTTIDPLKLFNLNSFNVPVDLKLIIARLARSGETKLVDTEYRGITYGKGGAHYAKPGFHEDIYEFDVASQYPNIIVLWKLLKTPQALEYFEKTMIERLAIKHDKSKSHINQALKLILNSLSGAFRIKSSYSVAFDPASGEAMCYIAQLIISELAFASPADDLIEVNTDSVFVRGQAAAEALRIKIKELTEKYRMGFEEEHTDGIYFRDVNNYIKYKKDPHYIPIAGKGDAYSDFQKKNSITAVYKILFMLLPLKGPLPPSLPWSEYSWTEYIYKYHKSAASKYGSIGGEPLTHKNYYFMWTKRDCPDAQSISFSRDLINRQNGSIKARFGVYAFDIKDLEQYKDYIDYSQYHRDLDDELELWNREDLCTTRLSKDKRKTLKDVALF